MAICISYCMRDGGWIQEEEVTEFRPCSECSSISDYLERAKCASTCDFEWPTTELRPCYECMSIMDITEYQKCYNTCTFDELDLLI